MVIFVSVAFFNIVLFNVLYQPYQVSKHFHFIFVCINGVHGLMAICFYTGHFSGEKFMYSDELFYTIDECITKFNTLRDLCIEDIFQ